MDQEMVHSAVRATLGPSDVAIEVPRRSIAIEIAYMYVVDANKEMFLFKNERKGGISLK